MKPSADAVGVPTQRSPLRQSGRARPLPPDERRAAIIAATLPLILQHGTKVTSRQIADAAGIAEGTIFRVFADKDELIHATVTAALDPAPVLAELSGVDQDHPLDERMVLITAILQRRMTGAINLVTALGRQTPPDHHTDRQHSSFRRGHAMILKAVAALLEPDRDRFRVPVDEVVRILRLLTFAASHPQLADGSPLSPEEIATAVLYGVRSNGP